MAYPDWVMTHKKKGLYVNKVNDETYRLYKGHSERVPGTNTVKRIVDEYIGTIYKSRGLVKSQPKVKGTVRVLRYGLSCLLYQLFYQYTAYLKRTHAQSADELFVQGLLRYQYGPSGNWWYSHDWLSLRYPGLTLPDRGEDTVISRMQPMLGDTMESRFGKEVQPVIEAAARLYRVEVNGRWMHSERSQEAVEIAKKYEITWEI